MNAPALLTEEEAAAEAQLRQIGHKQLWMLRWMLRDVWPPTRYEYTPRRGDWTKDNRMMEALRARGLVSLHVDEAEPFGGHYELTDIGRAVARSPWEIGQQKEADALFRVSRREWRYGGPFP